jgi:hypothetical protein
MATAALKSRSDVRPSAELAPSEAEGLTTGAQKGKRKKMTPASVRPAKKTSPKSNRRVIGGATAKPSRRIAPGWDTAEARQYITLNLSSETERL